VSKRGRKGRRREERKVFAHVHEKYRHEFTALPEHHGRVGNEPERREPERTRRGVENGDLDVAFHELFAVFRALGDPQSLRERSGLGWSSGSARAGLFWCSEEEVDEGGEEGHESLGGLEGEDRFEPGGRGVRVRGGERDRDCRE